ncbi:hypothetical protein PRUPE_1G131600 [Prunus persica]|uniref:Uncharacterized protein n=1 Tax=Prunus persica TaxID=3760 RepID=A0A251QWI6_PRUPE|nr:hypothetical protein PRUPE_1G131600 [Prunus persica]
MHASRINTYSNPGRIFEACENNWVSHFVWNFVFFGPWVLDLCLDMENASEEQRQRSLLGAGGRRDMPTRKGSSSWVAKKNERYGAGIESNRIR